MNERCSPTAVEEKTKESGQLHAFYDQSSPVHHYPTWRPAGYWTRPSSPMSSSSFTYDAAPFAPVSSFDQQPSCSSGGATYIDVSPIDCDERLPREGFRRKTVGDAATHAQETRPPRKPDRYSTSCASGSQGGGSGKKERTGGGGGKHGETPAKNRGGSGKENRQLIAESNKKLPPKKRIRLH